ncbi:hypothetical protein P692DRAFT_20830239 [Suillus brevipes Sb2]|nr:hypothetical protein P692DRAFT_20830239 [Suillus brevipes Sb2]
MDSRRNALVIPFSTLASSFPCLSSLPCYFSSPVMMGFWFFDVDTWVRSLICLGPSINDVVEGSVGSRCDN